MHAHTHTDTDSSHTLRRPSTPLHTAGRIARVLYPCSRARRGVSACMLRPRGTEQGSFVGPRLSAPLCVLI
eukprot:1672117-Rhodomonas_salina.1